jgi:hypothetical protein
VWHERRNCEKMMQPTDHWRLFAFNSETTRDEKLEGQGTNQHLKILLELITFLWYIYDSYQIVGLIQFYALFLWWSWQARISWEWYRGFVVLKLCYISNEPLTNESLALSKKTYATINHNLLCHKLWLWMRLFALWFVNLGLALCSVKLVTLK